MRGLVLLLALVLISSVASHKARSSSGASRFLSLIK